ncbi:hypothetical protein GCM10023091_00130 [Ravibacter arvi]|uniref:Uncharacterized protein n=1 Tax=Ravibacter arvi TaxID=2051041 RepID=A0ABP8LLW2_9BACT
MDSILKRLSKLSEEQHKVLESLRFKDQDLSTKLGALLAFSGLMIATSIVQLSTSEGSIIHVDISSVWLVWSNVFSLLLLFGSGFFCIFGLTSTGNYSSDGVAALEEYKTYLKNKMAALRWSVILVLIGSSLVLLTFFKVILDQVFH